jgi:hypothetical protein
MTESFSSIFKSSPAKVEKVTRNFDEPKMLHGGIGLPTVPNFPGSPVFLVTCPDRVPAKVCQGRKISHNPGNSYFFNWAIFFGIGDIFVHRKIKIIRLTFESNGTT